MEHQIYSAERYGGKQCAKLLSWAFKNGLNLPVVFFQISRLRDISIKLKYVSLEPSSS